MRELSLKTWLGLLLTTAIILTFSIVGVAILLFRLPQIEQTGREQAQATAAKMSRLTEQFLGSVEAQLSPLADLASRLPAAQLQIYLDATVGDGTTFDAISVVDIDGLVKAAGLPLGRRAVVQELLNADFSANRLFIAARNRTGVTHDNQDAVWSDRYLSALSGQVTIGLALHAGRHTIVGELSRQRLLDLMQGFGHPGDPKVIVTDSRGQWLGSNDPDSVLSHFNFGALPSFRAIIAGHPLPPYETIDGRQVLPGGVVSPRLGWVFGAGVPAGMDNPNYRITIILVVLGFFGSISIALALAPLWASRMERPIRSLIQYAHNIAAVDYRDVRPAPGNVTELNQLGTDLGLMAQAIREREERLRATLENTPSVAVQWYDRTGKIMYWNRASETMYGYSAEEAIGVSVSESPLMYLDRQQANDFIAILQQIETSGRPPAPAEFTLRRKDGNSVTVLASAFTIPGDAGEPIFVCMDIDITERKQAEAALRDNQRKLEAIFNASPAPMSVSDVGNAYRVTDCNEAWVRQFRRRREDVRGLNGAEMGLWAKESDRRTFLDQLESGHFIADMEAWLVDGTGHSLLCRISALITELGGQQLLLMMAVDITAQRQIEDEIRALNVELEERVAARTEELSQANAELAATIKNLEAAQEQLVQSEKLAALGNLVAGIAHELNTPIGNGLMAVSTLADLQTGFQQAMAAGLRRSDLDKFLAGVVTASDISTRNLHRAAELISSFKQVAVDQTSVQRRRFQLAEVVHEILITLQPSFKRTPYRIETAIPDGIEFDSYPGPLGQVLANLINNAVLHGFEGRDHGTIRIEAETLAPDTVRLVVRDDGQGIAPDRQKHVFEPFFTTRLGQGGSGLGLHIVYNTVTSILGGTIALNSQPGLGTEFLLVLPQQAPKHSDAA